MSSRLSRRKLAQHTAQQIADGSTDAIDSLAALLVDEGREREVDMLARDIEDKLADLGLMKIKVETAHPLDNDTRRSIEQLFKDKSVYIDEVILPELIGGVRISTPSQRLDGTVLKKLNDLRSMN